MVKKEPSKYMKEIIRLNFVELIHKYDIHQAKIRVKGLKDTRQHLAKCFMKVYLAYRFKKYGENDPLKAKYLDQEDKVSVDSMDKF